MHAVLSRNVPCYLCAVAVLQTKSCPHPRLASSRGSVLLVSTLHVSETKLGVSSYALVQKLTVTFIIKIATGAATLTRSTGFLYADSVPNGHVCGLRVGADVHALPALYNDGAVDSTRSYGDTVRINAVFTHLNGAERRTLLVDVGKWRFLDRSRAVA
jgi:hypothetical protein